MIEFKNFCFTYEGEEKSALTNINLEVKAGQCVILTGLSGCGKTTLLRVINGLCPSVFRGTASGNFKTAFYDYKKSFAGLNSRYVGSILQNPKSGFLFADADDECKYSAKCTGDKKEEIEHKFGMLKKKYSALLLHKNILNLSSGEAQSLSVLSSYIKSPQIVVMDEPTANLDINEIDQLIKHINELKRNGVTIVIVEHRVGYLKDICDKLYVMEEGSIIESDTFEARGENIAIYDAQKSCNQAKNSILEISNLNYSIKDNKILSNVNLSLKSGTVTAIVGKNGSGKTTLGKCVSGLVKTNKNFLRLDNRIISKRDRVNASYFCMQDAYHQMVTASVKEEIVLQGAKLTDSDIKDILNMVDIDGLENKHPSKLSGGQVLRLAVLLAYISNNKIVVLDEPTSGLDLKRMELICKLIKKMRDEGRFVILISHDLELLSKVADEYILLENGKAVAHRELLNQDDFDEMVSKIKHKKDIEDKTLSKDKAKALSKINPIVNLIVFFTIANAIFFYPSGQSSVYLMGLLGAALILNKNYKLSIKMVITYFLINHLKVFCPLYYQAFIEIFIIRGMMCGYALKNLTVNTKLMAIIESLEKINLTDYIIIPIISLIRLFPIMRYDSLTAYMSLKTRKLVAKKNPVTIWQFIIVPIVFSLVRSAENLSLGFETKGMIINKKRTLLTDVKFTITDYAFSVMYISIYTFLMIGGIK